MRRVVMVLNLSEEEASDLSVILETNDGDDERDTFDDLADELRSALGNTPGDHSINFAFSTAA